MHYKLSKDVSENMIFLELLEWDNEPQMFTNFHPNRQPRNERSVPCPWASSPIFPRGARFKGVSTCSSCVSVFLFTVVNTFSQLFVTSKYKIKIFWNL